MIRSSSAASASSGETPSDLGRLPAPGWRVPRVRPRPMTWLQWASDVAFALAFEIILGWPYVIRADFTLEFAWPLVPSVALYALALAIRRWLPGPALAIGVLALALKLVLGQPPHGSDLAIFVLIFSAAAYGSRTSQTASAVVAVGAPAAVLVYVMAVPQNAAFWSILGGSMSGGFHVAVIIAAVLWFALVLCGALFWGGGILRRVQLRSRDAQHRRELAELESQRSREQLIVEQERNRIARDMHDVIAHSLAVVVAQADGGRYAVRARPEAAEPTLQTIAEIAREALVDVRGLLAQLRHSQAEGPQAGLDDVAIVLERMGGAGLAIEHRLAGQRRPIGNAAELAVYRLVQESLTNSLRHGDPSAPTRLTVTWSASELEVLVENRVSRVPPPPREDSGHGLIGMRERIMMIGGRLETGAEGEVFRVRARVPVQQPASGSGRVDTDAAAIRTGGLRPPGPPPPADEPDASPTGSVPASAPPATDWTTEQ